MKGSQALRSALKQGFYPFVLSKGFAQGKATALFTPFARIADGKAQFFEIQWDKYRRPCFVINFGDRPYPAADDASPAYCGRLQRRRGGSMRAWFQTRKPWLEALRTWRRYYEPEEVVTQLIECFAELETWWSSGEEGPHLQMWRKRGD
ncbi:hypothetical protein AAFN46_02035 [Pseudomonas sp. CAU 1711]|uniref:hypothetical protein n=1 Tax=Pseudomonas sp. CAU 1711 TaxID=3140356 RepID=UPI003260FED6